MLVGNFLAVSDRHQGMDRKPGRPNNLKSISIVQFDCYFNSLLEVVVLLLRGSACFCCFSKAADEVVS